MDTYRAYADAGRPIEMLMECWLLSQSTDPQIRADNEWAVMEPSDDARDDPERAWSCLLIAARDERFKNHLGLLAASTLEDLLSFHGAAYIERVEAEAKSDPRFAWMLGGVWQFQMSEEIWSRVQAVWDRSGWDGNPDVA